MHYDCLSIVAAILLPKGQTRLVSSPPRDTLQAPPELGTNLEETFPHLKPPPGTPGPKVRERTRNLPTTAQTREGDGPSPTLYPPDPYEQKLPSSQAYL
jgi:hypothetical protein